MKESGFLKWRALLFYSIILMFYPVILLGVVITYLKLFYMRFVRSNFSITAIGVLKQRYILHYFGLREDFVTAALLRRVCSSFSLFLTMFPLYLAYKTSGWFPINYPPSNKDIEQNVITYEMFIRTSIIDSWLSRHLGDMCQFVVLGAGFDTRPYIDAFTRNKNLRIFEVDAYATQKYKKELLDKSGIDTQHLTFVSVDFNKDDVFERLKEKGYDPNKKSFFLWEGVVYYLPIDVVSSTLTSISKNCAPGSLIALDYFGDAITLNKKWNLIVGGMLISLKLLREPLLSCMDISDDEKINKLLNTSGVKLSDNIKLGQKSRLGVWGGVLLAST